MVLHKYVWLIVQCLTIMMDQIFLTLAYNLQNYIYFYICLLYYFWHLKTWTIKWPNTSKRQNSQTSNHILSSYRKHRPLIFSIHLMIWCCQVLTVLPWPKRAEKSTASCSTSRKWIRLDSLLRYRKPMMERSLVLLSTCLLSTCQDFCDLPSEHCKRLEGFYSRVSAQASASESIVHNLGALRTITESSAFEVLQLKDCPSLHEVPCEQRLPWPSMFRSL